MSENISLQIFTPDRTFLNRKVYRVVLPYGRVNLTVISDRAPTSLVLPAGKLDILKNDNQIEVSYFIDGGVVDIADNVCKLSTRHIIKTTDISAPMARELQNTESQNTEFYGMIAEYLENHT